jgi:hypothetical protein
LSLDAGWHTHILEVSLLPVFRWFESTGVGIYGRKSAYFFPVIEVVHLLGLTLLLGTVLMVNLRLLGLIMNRHTVPDVVRGARPLLWLGVLISLASGSLLFLTEAVKCYYNVAFWYKMSFLAAAILFQLAAQNRLMATSLPRTPLRAIAALSLFLWLGVGIAGRAIAFV